LHSQLTNDPCQTNSFLDRIRDQERSDSQLILLKHIQPFADFYRVMLGPKGDPLFAQHLRQNTEKRFRSSSTKVPTELGPDEPPVDLRLSCIAYAGLGAITWWLEQKQSCSPEQLTDWLRQISRAIARGLHHYAHER
jgi:hypothetical protein